MKNDAFETVASAYPGDFGWVWMDDKWTMAQVCDEHIALYPRPQVTEYHDLHDSILALPWWRISEPPCDGTDDQTHHVIVRDKHITATCSLKIDSDEGGKRLLREVIKAARDFAGVSSE